MNLFDIILLLPVAYGLYAGYNKGIIKQFTGLIGIVLALLYSFKLSDIVSSFLLENNLVQNDWRTLIGFILTFIGILIVVRLVGNVVKTTSRTLGLSFIEQILGGIFGALKSFLIVLVLLFFFLKINEFMDIVPESTINTSLIYPYYKIGFEYIVQFWDSNATMLE